MRSSKHEKRAMARLRSSLSTLTAGRPLPAALLVGSVALMGLVTSAFADGEGTSGDEEATATSALESSGSSDESASSEVRHGPAELRAPAGHGPPRLRARLKASSEASEESIEAAASAEAAEGAEKEEAAAPEATDEAPLETLGLPTGADKSGV